MLKIEIRRTFLFLGMRFAVMEIKTLVFHLIRNFLIVPNKKTDIPLELLKDRAITLAPKNGFHMAFKKRQIWMTNLNILLVFHTKHVDLDTINATINIFLSPGFSLKFKKFSPFDELWSKIWVARQKFPAMRNMLEEKEEGSFLWRHNSKHLYIWNHVS